MPHNYNRAAFHGLPAGSNVLLSLYCSLVALELAIKDHFAAVGWRIGHRVADWVTELGEAALAVQLSNRLAALQCTGKGGNVVPATANSYPDIRYLQHESDFVGMSNDAQIQQALQVVIDIRTALIGRGIPL